MECVRPGTASSLPAPASAGVHGGFSVESYSDSQREEVAPCTRVSPFRSVSF
ncbi:hypothetical protein PGT21_011149 [Puccinia graminis f. sp. tritici]|uniref:Uncharacterized protein n=1 Tax=Puccinia graminis f. sp. tritici TaxID=56615 RepID=A0A5B0RRU2_PUCGR|nr:hypothetical protein PGT21_011452 [Puccinia graminis f. sp. tritici]KAA1114492.1 hypothetical protein PGT21_011149 [Puccinia graminis f. sp. tritici]KAA1124971.1 hypothetical protein PGTUg99_002422 [Puccinia graminis f. sp. tritici]KAA1127745.1 hypothetical protein PGTUg99_001342 [Puccinia graminis f. sp. tritici]